MLTINVSSSSNSFSLLSLEACSAVPNPAPINPTSVHLSVCLSASFHR